MGDPRNLKSNGNQNNSTNDDRVIWEDGQWAIIEAGDCWDGLSRSKTRDSIGDAVAAPWDPGMTTMPGPNSVTAKKLVKVKLAELLAKPATAARGVFPTPASFKDNGPVPAAPVSPFLPKPWKGKDIPEYPHVCRVCQGRYYQGLDKVIHEATEHSALQGACPGPSGNSKRPALHGRSSVP